MVSKKSRTLLAAALLTGALCVTGPPVTQAAPGGAKSPTADQLRALEAGLQVAPKARTVTTKARPSQPNPYLANLPDVTKIDYAGWQAQLARQSSDRARSTTTRAAKDKAAGRAVGSPLIYNEQEPAKELGSNDTRADAELVPGFGTAARKNPRVRILGTLADLAPPARAIPTAAEDNGELALATATGVDGLGRVNTSGVLGDGPHGSDGDGSNDFDFFQITSREGLSIVVDTGASPVDEFGFATDTVVGLYDAEGTLVAVDDDGGDAFLSSRLEFPVPSDGVYYALVMGFSEDGPLPEDPEDSGSGAGGAEEGQYNLSVGSYPIDTDSYAVDLTEGDVLGASGAAAAGKLTVYRPDGTEMIGSNQDLSGIYPPQSPLPGGGNAVLSYVAEQTGRYVLQVQGQPGRYDVTGEVYRPGSEIDPSTRVQTIFLDFDGARLNTAIFGGPGVRTLSPFRAFIAKWGLNRTQEANLVNRITAGVQENIQRDLIQSGLNRNLSVKVVNSRNSADVFGRTNVSRVVVGGTIVQSGIPTIGIAQFIDPGNYSHEDTALVLLDVLSGSPTAPSSLNYYLKPSSDRTAFVSQALSNVIAHEVGHYIGSFHTDNLDATPSLMDAGGANFGTLFGVGPDGVGGTRDDIDVDFVLDDLYPLEGLTGKENTQAVSSWAFVRAGSSPRARP